MKSVKKTKLSQTLIPPLECPTASVGYKQKSAECTAKG